MLVLPSPASPHLRQRGQRLVGVCAAVAQRVHPAVWLPLVVDLGVLLIPLNVHL
jgi:hypothetical protein